MASEQPPVSNTGGFSLFRYRFESAGRGPVFWGFAVLVPLLIMFGLWAVLAPLNAAAIANAEVVLNEDRKSVQHLEGGIVESILVQEAQVVEKGEPVLIIRDISQRTQIDTLKDQLANARALNARLIAERDNAQVPDFSGIGLRLDLSGEMLESLRTSQQSLFQTRKASLTTKIELIKARKKQAGKEVDGLNFQLTSIHKQLAMTRQEFQGINSLYDKGMVTLTQKLEMEKTIVDLEGRIGALTANIAELRQGIVASDIEIIDLKQERQKEVLAELQANELAIQELSHQFRVITDALERTVVKAPVRGIVMDLQVHTIGAVVAPGQRILDVVPMDDRLILEARLNPNDIDIVTAGTKAKVMLTAYKAKKVPKIDGEVISVSGDILTDVVSGERYFLARVVVDDSIFNKLKNDIDLYPGMPAQVFFLAGERTLADYLLSPIVDAIYRAFREE